MCKPMDFNKAACKAVLCYQTIHATDEGLDISIFSDFADLPRTRRRDCVAFLLRLDMLTGIGHASKQIIGLRHHDVKMMQGS